MDVCHIKDLKYGKENRSLVARITRLWHIKQSAQASSLHMLLIDEEVRSYCLLFCHVNSSYYLLKPYNFLHNKFYNVILTLSIILRKTRSKLVSTIMILYQNISTTFKKEDVINSRNSASERTMVYSRQQSIDTA